MGRDIKDSMMSKEKKITKGVLYVLVANTITVIVNVITNFLLPKKLSVDTYASIKTFQLYMNYVGVFHLGFVDGVYLKYGGREIESISNKELNHSKSVLLIFQGLVSVVVLMLAHLVSDPVLFLFALAILPVNATALFKMLFQATGDFKEYRKITNISTILLFAINVLLCGTLAIDDFNTYLLMYVLIDYAVLIAAFRIIKKKDLLNDSSCYESGLTEFFNNIKSGFALMCGNFLSFLLTGLDRWFVKIMMTTYAFAQYSFAVSMENMLNLMVTPISIPLYNYFCTEKDHEKICLVHRCVIFFSFVIISLAYVAGFAVSLILPNYTESLRVLYLLFSAQGIQIIIKCVYVNLYKARKMQKTYFIKLAVVIISGVVFNFLLYKMLQKKEAFAVGTLLSSILWYAMSIYDFRTLIASNKSDQMFVIFELALFLVCGMMLSPALGLVIYIASTLLFAEAFMKGFLKEAYNYINSHVRRSYHSHQ